MSFQYPSGHRQTLLQNIPAILREQEALRLIQKLLSGM
jgi:hypothetical protein